MHLLIKSLRFVFVVSCLLGAAEFLAPQQLLAKVLEIMNAASILPDMIDKAKPAVVHLVVKKKRQENKLKKGAEEDFFDNALMKEFFNEKEDHSPKQRTDSRDYYGHGSGFVISQDGLILTNAHVVVDAETIEVVFPDKRSYPAVLKGTDKQSDVALLDIEGANFPVLPLGDSERLRVGELAVAIGSPFEVVQTVTAGIISATGRNNVGISGYEDFIQTDAAINPGNSGGPLLNADGQVVGINTAFVTQTGGYMGVGFAIPISMAQIVAERLEKQGAMKRGWLGIALKDVSPEMLTEQALPPGTTNAALIHTIEKGSPAASGGLREGDLLIALDGTAVRGGADVRNRAALATPGSKMRVRYFRQGKQNNITVVLGEKMETIEP